MIGKLNDKNRNNIPSRYKTYWVLFFILGITIFDENLNTYGINSRILNVANDGGDANKLTRSGIYYITPNTANMPENSSYNIMINIRASGGNDGVQLSMGISNSELYYRKKLNGVWDAWKTV